MVLRDAIKSSFLGDVEVSPEGVARVILRLEPDFPGFEGHFPGNPVCPGVIQVVMALTALEASVGGPLKLMGIYRAKFLRPILPGEAVTLTATPKDGGRVEARFFDDSGNISMISARYEGAAP